MPFNPLHDISLLPLHDIHRIIRVIQVIPPRTLMRRIARPDHTELILLLRLRSPDPAVRPGRSANVCATTLEAVHDCGYDRLHMSEVSSWASSIGRD